MTYEITFKPAKGKGPEMAYRVAALSLIEATRTARRLIDIEAPGYMLAGHREIAA